MTLREAWCFVMVLAFSRHMVVRVVFDQRIETWLQLHMEAFAEFGGVVETVVPDVKYVKGNFFVGRQESEVEEVRRDLRRWVYEIAGNTRARHHGQAVARTIQNARAAALMPLPKLAREPVIWRRVKVHRDSHIALDKRRYSVPRQQLGQRVLVRACAHTLAIYADDVRVATHSRRGKDYRSTVESHLPDHRSELRHRSRA